MDEPAAPADAAGPAGRPALHDDPDRNVYICDRCGDLMDEVHCKIICPSCGYTRDCSDP